MIISQAGRLLAKGPGRLCSAISLRLFCTSQWQYRDPTCKDSPLGGSEHDHQQQHAVPKQSYGYLDWNVQQSYGKAMKMQYFLDDVLLGCEKLSRNSAGHTHEQLRFMLYTLLLYPAHYKPILSQFLPAFIRSQSQSQSYKQCPAYMDLLVAICNKARHFPNVDLTIVQPYLLKRIMSPQNCDSVVSFQHSLRVYLHDYFENIRGLCQHLQLLAYRQMRDTNYKLSEESVYGVVWCYGRIRSCRRKHPDWKFFASMPEIYTSNEQTFQNFIQFLTSIVGRIDWKPSEAAEILEINNKIAECYAFIQPRTLALLQTYAEHLTIVNLTSTITFIGLLNPI